MLSLMAILPWNASSLKFPEIVGEGAWHALINIF